MTERARRISAENLDRRLPVSNPHDELGRLAATLQRTTDASWMMPSEQHRFMADTSHELRTPLSRRAYGHWRYARAAGTKRQRVS